MKTLILFFISINIAFAQKAMFAPAEAESLKKIYQQLDGKNWQINAWEQIDKDKIYLSSQLLNYIGVSSKKDRDTLINDETIAVFTITSLNIGLAIGKPKINNERIQGGNFPECFFPNIEKFTLFHVNGTFGLENISFSNLKELYLKDCFLWGVLEINSMPKLEIVDFNRAEIDVNLRNLNLPNCKIFNLIGTKLKQILTIENLLNVEIFQIREWRNHEWDYQEPGQFSLFGSEIKEIKKLKNAKEIAICYAAITGELDTLELEHLEKLELYANGIEGAFPEFNCPKLKHIDFQGNRLTHFNKGIENENLEYLNLMVNNLSGEIPKFNTPKLKKLQMRHNKLSSGLENILTSNQFTYIALDVNNFEQELNFDIIAPDLEFLSLNKNKLKGNIPKIHCEKMFYLSLAYNKFTNYTNDLVVNLETFIYLGNNLIPIWDIAERCENFPEIDKTNQNVYTSPNHIFDYFYVNDGEKWMNYTGFDFYKEGKNGTGYLFLSHKIHFDINENRIFPDIVDTANYTYEIYKYSDWRSEKISDDIYFRIKELGRYHIEMKSKHCDVRGRTEIIDIQQLSVPTYENISVYKNSNELIIDNTRNELIEQVYIIDLLGNTLHKSINATTNNIQFELKNPNQPLFVRLLIDNQWVVKKVI